MSTHIPRAVCFELLASLMFATMGIAIRYSSGYLSNEMIVFLRNGFGLCFLLAWLYRKGFRDFATKRLIAHITRSVSGLTAMYCFFYAIAHLQLAEAVLLNYSAPVFIAIIAVVWLGERPSKKLAGAIIIGFIGVCFTLKPGAGMFQSAALIGLLSGVFAAFAMVTIRDLSATEPTLRIVFYFSLTSTLISAVPVFWTWQAPVLQAILTMAFAGLTATLGQIMLTYSYSLAPAAQVGPYTYSAVVFAACYGWIFWQETPDIFTLIGALLVIMAGTITLQRRSIPKLAEPD